MTTDRWAGFATEDGTAVRDLPRDSVVIPFTLDAESQMPTGSTEFSAIDASLWRQERFRWADFETEEAKECQNEWGLSDEGMRTLQKYLTGEPVRNQWSDTELKQAGYTSNKQYEIEAAIRNY